MKGLREQSQELVDRCDLTVLGDELEVSGAHRMRAAHRSDARMHDGALVEQSDERRPRRHVQRGDDFQRLAGAPRRTCSPVLRQRDSQRVEAALNLSVITTESGEDIEQLPCDVLDDVVVKDRPAHLKHGHTIVTE